MDRPIAWGVGPESETPDTWSGTRGILLTGYLRRIDKKIRQSIDRDLEPYGLTHRQAVVIRLLHEAGDYPVYQKVLERELELTNPAVTSIIKTMVRKGLVRREQEEHDGRYYRLYLTDEGNALCDAAKQGLIAGNRIFEERLNAQELDELEALMAKLVHEEGSTSE